MRRWDGLRWHDINTKFHEDWYMRSSNIKIMSQKFEGPQCWYYWWDGFMNCAIQMGSGAMIVTRSFINIGSGIKKLLGRIHTDCKVIS
jgi:hypothetical protein